jgi:hypothetical protein
MLAIKDKELAALQDAQFSAELDALEKKNSVKEKIEVQKEEVRPDVAVKEKLLLKLK